MQRHTPTRAPPRPCTCTLHIHDTRIHARTRASNSKGGTHNVRVAAVRPRNSQQSPAALMSAKGVLATIPATAMAKQEMFVRMPPWPLSGQRGMTAV
eukprot:4648870-Alexandrium_andersonii.AAC.1